MIRSFVALTLPDAVRTQLAALCAGLSAGRSVPPGNYHITLAFLDDQPESALTALHDELSLITAAPVYTQITGIGVVGGDVPRLLVADVERSATLLHLHRAVQRAIRDVGIRLKRREFRPHVTLSRLPQRPDPRVQADLAGFHAAHADWSLPGLVPERFALYRSSLTPDGPVYTPLAEYALAGHY